MFDLKVGDVDTNGDYVVNKIERIIKIKDKESNSLNRISFKSRLKTMGIWFLLGIVSFQIGLILMKVVLALWEIIR